LRECKATYRRRNKFSNDLLGKNYGKNEHAVYELTTWFICKVHWEHIPDGVGRNNEKNIVMKFFFEKIFSQNFFEITFLSVSNNLSVKINFSKTIFLHGANGSPYKCVKLSKTKWPITQWSAWNLRGRCGKRTVRF